MVTWNWYYPYHYLEIMRGRAIRGTTNPQNSTTFRSLRAFRNQMWLCVFCISKKNKIVIKCRNDQVDELQGLKKKPRINYNQFKLFYLKSVISFSWAHAHKYRLVCRIHLIFREVNAKDGTWKRTFIKWWWQYMIKKIVTFSSNINSPWYIYKRKYNRSHFEMKNWIYTCNVYTWQVFRIYMYTRILQSRYIYNDIEF